MSQKIARDVQMERQNRCFFVVMKPLCKGLVNNRTRSMKTRPIGPTIWALSNCYEDQPTAPHCNAPDSYPPYRRCP